MMNGTSCLSITYASMRMEWQRVKFGSGREFRKLSSVFRLFATENSYNEIILIDNILVVSVDCIFCSLCS